MEIANFIKDVVIWVVETAIKLANGDESSEVKRLEAALPEKLQADAAHLRQRRLLEAELRADMDDDLEEDSRDDDES